MSEEAVQRRRKQEDNAETQVRGGITENSDAQTPLTQVREREISGFVEG